MLNRFYGVLRLQILIIITFFIFNKTNAQIKYIYADSNFIYELFGDSVLSSDGINHDCFIKTITIIRQHDDKIVQVITPPENTFFCQSPSDQIFIIEDMNFDGLNDIRLVQETYSPPNIAYYCWIFNKKNQQFLRDTLLETITSPEFDHKKKIISSFWRASCCDHGISFYKYIKGKITLIAEDEVIDDPGNSGQQIATEKKLVHGKMKLVERKVTKADESGN